MNKFKKNLSISLFLLTSCFYSSNLSSVNAMGREGCIRIIDNGCRCIDPPVERPRIIDNGCIRMDPPVERPRIIDNGCINPPFKVERPKIN